MTLSARRALESTQLNILDGIKISRIKPTILSGHMSDIQWNTFCEDIDRALARSELKKLSKWMTMSVIFSFLLFGVAIAFSVSGRGTWFWIFIAGSITIGFVLYIYLIQRYRDALKFVISGLKEVCTSSSNSDVKFRVIEDEINVETGGLSMNSRRDIQRLYIEVTVASTASNTNADATTPIPTESPIVQAFAVTEPSAPLSNDLEMGSLSTNKTSITARREQRMAELDAMKDRISEDEYYAKRAEILSDV